MSTSEKKYYAQGVGGAGDKFDNYKFGFGKPPSEKKYAENVLVEMTGKSSGTMIRMIAHPTSGHLVVGTKNGVEEKYLFTFQNVFLKQLGSETLKTLRQFLKETRWELNCELVTSSIISPDGKVEACAHGCKPLTDHVIIHGGTKSNFDTVTLFDLLRMRATIKQKCSVQGIYFPHCIWFEAEGVRGMQMLEEAFVEVNNKVVFPRILEVAPCSLDEAVFSMWQGENWIYWITAFRAEACRRGVRSCQVFDHDVGTVDNGEVFEGWVPRSISKKMLEEGEMYEKLKLCLDLDSFVFDETKVPVMEDILTGSYENDEAVEILMGFKYEVDGVNTRKLTVEEMLERYAAGPVLLEFLWHLVQFVESDEGVMGGLSKTSFSLQLATLDTNTAVMTVTMKGEHQWYLYQEFYKKNVSMSCIKLSRGFTILLTLDSSQAMQEVSANIHPIPENREKWKQSNYVPRTMVVRPFYESLYSKKGFSWDDDFKRLFDIGFLTRWGIVSCTARYTILKYWYLFAAYCSTRVKDDTLTYLDVTENMMARLSSKATGGEEFLNQYMDVRGASLTPSNAGCAMIEALADDGDSCFEIEVIALNMPSDVRLMTLVKDIELGFKKGNEGGGFMFVFLGNNQKANTVKGKLSSLLLLTLKYNFNFIFQNSKKIEPLTVVLVAATPGMGKTTYLSELARQINKTNAGRFNQEGACIVIGGDICLAKSGKERHMTTLADAAACIKADPRIQRLFWDRCCVSDLSSVRMQLKEAFPDKILHIHMMIPDHGVTKIQGNDDWFLPFSLEQMALNACSVLLRKHNDGQMPSVNAVEGGSGFDIAIQHMVAARTSLSIADQARKEFKSLAGTFSVSYFKYTKEVELIPQNIMIALQLNIGLHLSKETKQSIEKGSKQKIGLSDGLILKTLALSLRNTLGTVDALESLISSIDSTGDNLASIWPEWLNDTIGGDAIDFVSKVRLPMKVTVQEMISTLFEMSSESDVSKIVCIPFIPQYFGIQVIDSLSVKHNLQSKFEAAVGSKLYVRDGDLHVTSFVPSLSIGECGQGGSILNHLSAVLEKRLFKFRIHQIVSGPTTNAVFITDIVPKHDGEFLPVGDHMTLMCAGPNKDSTSNDRISLATSVDHNLIVEGIYVGKMRAPSIFGYF